MSYVQKDCFETLKTLTEIEVRLAELRQAIASNTIKRGWINHQSSQALRLAPLRGERLTLNTITKTIETQTAEMLSLLQRRITLCGEMITHAQAMTQRFSTPRSTGMPPCTARSSLLIPFDDPPAVLVPMNTAPTPTMMSNSTATTTSVASPLMSSLLIPFDETPPVMLMPMNVASSTSTATTTSVAIPVMPMISQHEIDQLLLHVARGEQDQAEAMARANPNLLLGKGNVTDYSERMFTNITAFQYALWAWDWHMWTMLMRYLPQPFARDQLSELETQGTAYGQHYDFNDLLIPYKTYIEFHSGYGWDHRNKHWNTVIGKAQTRVPAHVAQEYCRGDRTFYPTPSFKEDKFPRTLALYANEDVWYPLGKMSYGVLGQDLGILKYNFSVRAIPVWLWYSSPELDEYMQEYADLINAFISWVVACSTSLTELCKVRTAQYEELKASFR